MRIPRIYLNQTLQIDNIIELDSAASHHLSRVLRARSGDPVTVFNGHGGEFRCRLLIEGKKVSADILEFNEVNRESNLDITLLQGISKGERMDFSIQKAVELGVKKIIPIICQRTVVNLKNDRSDKKFQHWQGVIINACEQSGRTLIPTLEPVVKLEKYLLRDNMSVKLTLDPSAEARIQQLDTSPKQLTLLIGPEGGLSQEEIELSKLHGYQGIKLGPRILRTETAGLAAVAAIQSHYGDF